ncbi:MAG: outer membrane protein assembly factor BamD [Spirochaetaceae bacterium]|nr:MAG: outer membrane protein assembly factor BamD [Spirochaetaceae bacterium]
MKKVLVVLVALAFLPPNVVSADDLGQRLMDGAIEEFRQARYTPALLTFREVLADPDFSRHHADAYFWAAKTAMAASRFDEAARNLDRFLSDYTDSPYYAEAEYQRGRLLFLQNEHRSAIQVFEAFIAAHPDSPFVPNAYYWTAEALFRLGRIDEAAVLFRHVVRDFPSSARVEAAQYRLSVIDYAQREKELLELLRWSHSETLRAVEEFERKERSYREAVQSYQERLRSLASDDFRSEIERLTAERDSLSRTVAASEATIERLKTELDEARMRLSSTDANDEPTLRRTAPTTLPSTAQDIGQRAALLELKNTVLEIKSTLLDVRNSGGVR